MILPPTTFVGSACLPVRVVQGFHLCASELVSSVTAETDRLTINLQLIEPRSRRVLWGRQYEGTRGTYNEMTRQAADGIRQVLRPVSTMIASSKGLASTSEAELAFRQGLHYSYRYNNQKNAVDFDAALKSFKRALDLDPKFADTAAEIAWIYGFKSEIDEPPNKSIAEANRWSRQALAINDRCSKAWSRMYGSGFADSLDYALRGVKYGPKDSYAYNTLGFALEGVSTTLALSAYQTAICIPISYGSYLRRSRTKGRSFSMAGARLSRARSYDYDAQS